VQVWRFAGSGRNACMSLITGTAPPECNGIDCDTSPLLDVPTC
jgi:hypothetical protein